MSSSRGTRGDVIHSDDGEVEDDPIEPDEPFARMVSLEKEAVQARQRSSSATEVTDSRTLASRSRPQATLRNGQHGSEMKAVLERGSDWKKSKPVDEVNISVEVGEHCAEGEQQFYMFGTPDRYEEKNIDSVIMYICPLEGTEQVNVPVLPESKLSGPPTRQTRNDVWVTRNRVRHPADDTDSCCSGKTKRSPPVGHEHLGCDRQWCSMINKAVPRDVFQ